MKPPSFFIVGEFPCLMRLPRLFNYFFFFLGVTVIGNLLIFLFCSCSSSEEEVLVTCGKSKGILGDCQGF